MTDDAKVTASSDNREKVQRIVLKNILQADTCLKIWQSLLDLGSIKFLRVHRTLGHVLPQVLADATIMSLARLFDQSGHPAAVSLTRLVVLAEHGLDRTRVDELKKKITDHDVALAAIRDKYLAHSDIDRLPATVTLTQLSSMLEDAKEIHDCAVAVLFPKERWVKEYLGVEGDAKAFSDHLKTWDYPSRAEVPK